MSDNKKNSKKVKHRPNMNSVIPDGGKKKNEPRIKVNFDKIKREINIEQVIYWIGLQATCEEVAGSFRVSPQTLNNRLKEELGMTFAELRIALGNGAVGKLALRRYQFRQAETNSNMAIWLGKQWLGQKDVTHQNTTIQETGAVKIYLPDNGRNNTDTEDQE